jgi:uncharacterized protein YhaN
MPEEKIVFKTLTPEEIQTLQVDAALRLIGEYTVHLSRLNIQIGQAIMNLGNAKMQLDQLKNDKQTLIEMLRSLKVICERA